MELLLLIPFLAALSYSGMIIFSWQAYARENSTLSFLAKSCAVLSLLLAGWDVFSGQIFLVPFKLGAVWACWQLSSRTKTFPR